MLDRSYEDADKGRKVAELVDDILALDDEQLADLMKTLEIELRGKYYVHEYNRSD